MRTIFLVLILAVVAYGFSTDRFLSRSATEEVFRMLRDTEMLTEEGSGEQVHIREVRSAESASSEEGSGSQEDNHEHGELVSARVRFVREMLTGEGSGEQLQIREVRSTESASSEEGSGSQEGVHEHGELVSARVRFVRENVEEGSGNM